MGASVTDAFITGTSITGVAVTGTAVTGAAVTTATSRPRLQDSDFTTATLPAWPQNRSFKTATYNLRSINKIKFEQKKIWLRVFYISPLERGIKLWNMLPAVVQSLDYKPDFKKEVRHIIMLHICYSLSVIGLMIDVYDKWLYCPVVFVLCIIVLCKSIMKTATFLCYCDEPPLQNRNFKTASSKTQLQNRNFKTATSKSQLQNGNFKTATSKSQLTCRNITCMHELCMHETCMH